MFNRKSEKVLYLIIDSCFFTWNLRCTDVQIHAWRLFERLTGICWRSLNALERRSLIQIALISSGRNFSYLDDCNWRRRIQASFARGSSCHFEWYVIGRAMKRITKRMCVERKRGESVSWSIVRPGIVIYRFLPTPLLLSSDSNLVCRFNVYTPRVLSLKVDVQRDSYTCVSLA